MKRDPRETFILGTAIEIVATISIPTATTAKITILSPSLVPSIDSADMTKQVDRVYHYIYQSAENDLDGLYTIQFSITSGGYTTFWEDTFIMVRQTGD